MGGGGGCGDFNNGMGTTGTSGGGIIIIKANRIIGNGMSILANGIDQIHESHTIGDGSGGGGAGGSILLDVKNYDKEVKVEANGGKGGNQSPSALVACIGPGGGGGTGIVISRQVLPETVKSLMRPGASGLILNPDLPCYKTGYGAMEGEISVINYFKDEYAIGNRIKVAVKQDTLMIEEFKIMKNLRYLQAKHYLIDHSRNELLKLANAMRKYNSLEIELSGHTDYVGNPQLNLELSEKRVLFAKNYLLRQGIEEKRIQIKSLGGAVPLVSDDANEPRDKNRRVEIKVVKY
jgi:outer membrane protein OmpA-like peptidoglycan-associated protein